MKQDIKSLRFGQLKNVLAAFGEPSFRTGQIYEWLHKKLVTSPDEMSNLPLDLRKKLIDQFHFIELFVVERLQSTIDGTQKFLFQLPDGNIVESVFMRHRHGISVCVSSQVGCGMGCSFCASGIGGKIRNLAVSEMLEQIYRIQTMTGERISHVVVMGTGEPFDNYDNLVQFIDQLTEERGLHISQRNITVSTCGLVDQILAFAEEQFAVTLAISLHAPTDELRKTMMPIANRYNLASLMEACDQYFNKTGRRITFEYSLIENENDGEEQAFALAKLLMGKNCHVNLIPVNPIKERNFRRSGEERILKFKNLLEKNRINVTIRRGMGQDIEAACGQLRRRYAKGRPGGEQET